MKLALEAKIALNKPCNDIARPEKNSEKPWPETKYIGKKVTKAYNIK